MLDTGEAKAFFDRCTAAGNGGFKKYLSLWLEEVGDNFLEIISNEIIRLGAVDTGRLLGSFTKGGADNIWEVSGGGLSIALGSKVDYAGCVNSGHFQYSRFIPGVWQGGSFVYDPDSDTGMMLKQKWVEGKHYLDNAISILEVLLPGLLEEKFQKWSEGFDML